MSRVAIDAGLRPLTELAAIDNQDAIAAGSVDRLNGAPDRGGMAALRSGLCALPFRRPVPTNGFDRREPTRVSPDRGRRQTGEPLASRNRIGVAVSVMRSRSRTRGRAGERIGQDH
jgi:hypothetical protein